jgi:tRNA(fMet)-specific endonuclease VapC
VIVADTDVLIDTLRGREPVAGRVAQEIESANLATTVLSAFELLSGSREEGERERVEDLLGALVMLPLDLEAAAKGAALRRELEGRGEKIGLADYLIAGICLSRSSPLMTRNRRHFDRLPGLRFAEVDPGSSSPDA